MTIVTLFLYVGLVAALLTGLIFWSRKSQFHFADSFLQNFAGVLFIFSGFVKAVDPLGTAYKMEQYFTAFEDTCNGSFLKFLAPLFPLLSKYAISFSVFMIVLEIVLGIMLIIGYRRKLSAWLFFIIMIFFTILTGFTFLTGYVPTDVNFFEFGKWVEFNKTNMRVTDCGCFGDFIKLEPKISFIKDLILMVPACWFLFRWKNEHQLFSPIIRTGITCMSVLGLLLFSFSNFVWNEPVWDFRPFSNGIDIKSKLKAEQKAQADVEIIAYRIKSKIDKREMDVPYKDFLDSFKKNSNFKANWETLDQIKSEPSIPRTKISDFDILSLDGQSMTDFILDESRYNLMIISPKVKYESSVIEEERIDTIYKMDTTIIKLKKRDSLVISKQVAGTQSKKYKRNQYQWDEEYLNTLKTKFLPLIDSVRNDGVTASAVFGLLTEEGIADLKEKSGIDFPCYEADDLLLKTILRSNPGLILLKDGKIIHKWHKNQLPKPEELRVKYLNLLGNKIY
ncbi:MAG: MauE/DoxX family redox-associated membrane protein [Saprospiraceae bacterium]|nr:DoxX family membrane protein [Saprospiraceae bacterium]MBK8449971.1 DoxX family membrane protein [Saprospiraceae bacterium]MBK9221384.1 DoxX family membrane protein [Saprospiraceae bacterium]